MRNVEQSPTPAPFDPAPCTCTKEDRRKAQALREALRRRLLDRKEPETSRYWSVGAE